MDVANNLSPSTEVVAEVVLRVKCQSPHVVHPAKGSENHLAWRDIRELKLLQGALRQDSENPGTGSVFRG